MRDPNLLIFFHCNQVVTKVGKLVSDLKEEQEVRYLLIWLTYS